MKKKENQIEFSRNSIVRNLFYNLFGYGLPVLCAIFFIPPLITKLGNEKFGVLTLSWIIIGYFSFFDLGIGKGLTKIVAELLGLKKFQQIPEIFWTSLFLMLSISLLATVSLLFFVPTFNEVFSISKGMSSESQSTFYLLVCSIPIVSTSAGLRGILEAYQKFGIINIIRVSLGVMTFIGPFFILLFTNNLFWIVLFLIVIRVIIWIVYFIQCLKVNSDLFYHIRIKISSIKPVINSSIWITIANIIGPIILYADRFLISSIISAKSLIYYTTPYEIITKVQIIPVALSGVLFPLFSTTYSYDQAKSNRLFIKGIKLTFLIIFPITLFTLFFSHDGISFWLGEDFANNSSLILQFLSIGVLANCLSTIPDSFFQGIGKPKISTIIMLIELPFYIAIMYLSIHTKGLVGGAIVFMIGAIINSLIMFSISYFKYNIPLNLKVIALNFTMFIFGLLIVYYFSILTIKIISFVLLISLFVYGNWKTIIDNDDKNYLVSFIKTKIK